MIMSKTYKILWADDEIDLLKPHILFLESKGYQVSSVLSGTDAIEAVERENYDLISLMKTCRAALVLMPYNASKS